MLWTLFSKRRSHIIKISGKKIINACEEQIRKKVFRLASKLIVRPYINRLKVPVVAITGTNGKTTITRLLSRIYLNAGYRVGYSTTHGVWHNDIQVSNKDETSVRGAWKAARCKNVDILILENARGGLIKYGLGFKKCQVGVVTNLYEDHLGFDGINTLEEMAEIKSIIPGHTDKEGTVIINGDDANVRAMAKKSMARPIYFVLESDPNQFENVFFVKENCIWKKIDAKMERIIAVEEIPITFQGIRRYNIANSMAVLGAIEGLKRLLPVSDTIAIETLKDFGNNPYDNLERFHLITYKGETVAYLTSKNPASLSLEKSLIQKTKVDGTYKHVVGILTAPGNRNEKYYSEMSELAAPVCDTFFVRPPAPKYLRGRDGREIVRLLSSNIPEDKILSKHSTSLDEVIALSKKKLGGRNLFIVFFGDIEAKIHIDDLLKGDTSVR